MSNITAKQNLTNRLFTLILVCFFLSGLTGLIYEVLWVRMITKVIGAAPFAVSIVLTIFMAGLGIGSYLAARVIDRIKTQSTLVSIYGLLELATGFYALMIPLLLAAFTPIYAAMYNRLFSYFMLYNLLTFIGCSVILSIPVICMGATLPILCKFYVSKLSHLGTHAGRLYGLNTIGAALGALLCGFWLIDILGLQGTLFFAVFVNISIGLLCLVIGWRVTKFQQISENAVVEQPEIVESSYLPANFFTSGAIGALIIFAVSGFCAMAFEVIWTKLLGLVIGPTTYSFTIVLVTFILGLALGSMLFGWLADKTANLMRLLIITQISAAILVLAASQIMGNSQLFFAKLIFRFSQHFAMLNLLKAIILFLFMFLPTLFLGATFPLVGKIYTQSIQRVGRSIGFAYAVNTLGAVLGSFCAGFILIPFVGKEKGLSIVISMQLLTAIIIAAIYVLPKGKRRLVQFICFAVPVLAGLGLCLHFPLWNPNQLSIGKYYRFDEIRTSIEKTGWLEALLQGTDILDKSERGQLVYYADGIAGFTAVKKYPDPMGNDHYSLAISGKPDASSHSDMKTQCLLAHFPMLFHPNPKKVMVLGLASGITAGQVLCYPVDQVDVLDINKEVIKASSFFAQWNNNVLSNPKTNLIIQDGRAHLRLTKQKYDVIISEPSNPWMAGLADLFTQEMFAAAADRLNPDGMFVQFMHSYQMDWRTFSLVGRTFSKVFPNSILVCTEPAGLGIDYLLVGFNGSRPLSLQAAQQRIKYTNQSNIVLSDPNLLYRLIVSEDLGKLFDKGLINTDNRPYLEFASPKLMYADDQTIFDNLNSRKWLTENTRMIAERVKSDIDRQIDFAAYAFSVNAPFSGMVDLSKASAQQKERFYKIVERYCSNDTIDLAVLNDDEAKKRAIAAEIKAVTEKIGSVQDKALSYTCIGDLYHISGDINNAIENYKKSLEVQPGNASTHFNLAIAFKKQGNLDQALMHFYKAAELNPDLALTIHSGLANIFLNQNKLDEAVQEFNKALEIMPDNAGLHNDLGIVLARLGKRDQAIQHFKTALQLKPDLVEAKRNLDYTLQQ